jgi:PAS domain S-box-containing protein
VANEAEQQAVRVDTNGAICHWGREWQNASGYTSDEAVGHRIDLVIPPPLHTRHWRGFNKAIATGRLRHGDDDGRWTLKTVAVHKTGKLVPLRVTLELTHADDGAVKGAKGTILGPGPAWTAPVARAVFAALKLGQSARGRSRSAS